MPVTIRPASHIASAFRPRYNEEAVTNFNELFTSACYKEAKKMKNNNIIQTSFTDVTKDSNVYAQSNGFVDGAVRAYNNHQHLEIRPEDVWFSILSQLNVYIKTHAEELRDMFVTHQGQKHLEVIAMQEITGDTQFGVDWSKFSLKMSQLIQENVVDPSLRDWIMPRFTTTTKTDEVVASILMMSTLQKYFTYGCSVLCGLPSVTLLGEKSDWESLAGKAERIGTFGDEAKLWFSLLKPVLARFIASFDAPEAEETKDFWQKIAHYSGGGSGPTYLSGWITAFCFWNSEGHLVADSDFEDWGGSTPVLQLDEARYHRLETTEIPPGWASVPVMLDYYGVDIPCSMVAGSVGIRLRSSGNDFIKSGFNDTDFDTISIESGWWIYEGMNDEEIKAVKEARAKAEQSKKEPFYLMGTERQVWAHRGKIRSSGRADLGLSHSDNTTLIVWEPGQQTGEVATMRQKR
ncbi:uncharacterized protein LY89DRAFT_687443 [Mollisia scopiformis]|uniref:DUF4419 domain-containing protein n=1 Tax=Mollisia scopiformis TaxID=149040 RepID=A0A194WZ89_MOLSC|nr:uncharacterized protein LY89DRAFT_687443 [Mollisia scopiformis]KUJ13273.1 hypothetical protein LY89DRAFT_687443 [Mollisia scopiformis]